MENETITSTDDNPSADAIHAADEIREAANRKAFEFKQSALDHAEKLKESALEKSEQFRETAAEKVDTVKTYAEDNLGISGEKIEDLKNETEKFVKENPVKTAFIALGLGFVIGQILKK